MRWASGLVLVANMLVIILETDSPDHAYWMPLNVIFWVLLTVDVGLRFMYRGWHLGCARWRFMAFDLLLVALGIVDLLASSVVEFGKPPPLPMSPQRSYGSGGFVDKEEISSGMQMTSRRLAASTMDLKFVRLLQMTRLFRVFRIFKLIKKLGSFVNTLLQMFQSFAWIFLGMVVVWFVLAILLTQLLGHGLLLPDELDDELQGKVQTQFRDIVTTMYALFQLTTLDDWARIVIPIIEVNAMWQWPVMAYVILMSWTVLSLLTAVASETLITASSARKNEDVIKEEMQKKGFMGVILKHFAQVDEDGNNQLDKGEFKKFLEKEDVRQELKMNGMNLDGVDIGRMWDTFDVDMNGSLSVDELVQGFVYLQEQLATKHVANLGYSMKRFNHSIDKALDTCVDLVASLTEKQAALVHSLQENSLAIKDPNASSRLGVVSEDVPT